MMVFLMKMMVMLIHLKLLRLSCLMEMNFVLNFILGIRYII